MKLKEVSGPEGSAKKLQNWDSMRLEMGSVGMGDRFDLIIPPKRLSLYQQK